MFSALANLAKQVQKAAKDLESDFENQRQQVIHSKQVAGDTEERPLPLPRIPDTVSSMILASHATLISSSSLLRGEGEGSAGKENVIDVVFDVNEIDNGAGLGLDRNDDLAVNYKAEPLNNRDKESPHLTTSNKSISNIRKEEEELPWSGMESDSVKLELKTSILALSTDKRNFVVDPPEGTEFVFDMRESLAQALALLKVDPKLESMRFDLVPKRIKEPIFWRNYFYRVSLLRQTALILRTPEPLQPVETTTTTVTNSIHVSASSSVASPLELGLPRAQDLRESGITLEPSPTSISSAHSASAVAEVEQKMTSEELLDLGDSEEYGVDSFNGDWEKEIQAELNE